MLVKQLPTFKLNATRFIQSSVKTGHVLLKEDALPWLINVRRQKQLVMALVGLQLSMCAQLVLGQHRSDVLMGLAFEIQLNVLSKLLSM